MDVALCQIVRGVGGGAGLPRTPSQSFEGGGDCRPSERGWSWQCQSPHFPAVAVRARQLAGPIWVGRDLGARSHALRTATSLGPAITQHNSALRPFGTLVGERKARHVLSPSSRVLSHGKQ